MNRRTLLLTVAAGASGLAGCQSKSDCPPLLDVDKINRSEVTATGRNVVPYRQLREERQEEFKQALEEDNIELANTSDEWSSTDFVEYEGEYYAPVVAVC